MLLRAAAISLLLLALPTFAAASGRIDVSPTRLELGAKKSGMITLRNDGNEPLRFEISVHAWSQSETGQMQLGPTEDLVFFPAMLEIPAGESRPVRVGITEPAGNREAAYRLVVEQLPNDVTESAGMAVQVLTNLSLPIFVAPREARPLPRLDLDTKPNHVTLALHNDGDRHYVAGRITLRALDETGATIHEVERAGWYVLAGGEHRFVVPMPKGSCGFGHRVVADVELPGSEGLQIDRLHRCAAVVTTP